METTTTNIPLLDRNRLITALSHDTRWRILKELSAGEPMMVRELATRVGCSDTMASKHMAVLRDAGLVICRRQLYQLQPHHVPKPGEPIVDFGHCLLRLDRAE